MKAKERETKTALALLALFLLVNAFLISIANPRVLLSGSTPKSPFPYRNTLVESNLGNDLLAGWENTVETVHFTVHYNQTGPNAVTENYAIAASDAFENSWTKEIGDFGFRAPPDSHIDVAIMDIVDYGVTYYYGPPYHVANITIDKGLNTGLLEVTCAHEFFHTIQLSYDITEDAWIIEGTAAWIESKVYSSYTGTGSYISYVDSYMQNPNRALIALDYDACIFWIFLDEHYGGIPTIEDVLRQTSTKTGIDAVNNTLLSRGTTFKQIFKEFVTANALKDTHYSKGTLFDSPLQTSFLYDGSRVEFADAVVDWGAKYYAATSSAIYVEVQFMGMATQNVVRILIDGSYEIISDVPLNTNSTGTFRLMQASLLKKIFVVVESVDNETSSQTRQYDLVWLGSSFNSSGPCSAESSVTPLAIKNTGAQSSVDVQIETFDGRASQISSTTYYYIFSSSLSQISSTTAVDTLPTVSSQTSPTNALTTLGLSGSQSSGDTPVHLAPAPPVASFTYLPVYPTLNQSVIFDASASYDPDGYIQSYIWAFSDGNVTTTSSPVIVHMYSVQGEYNVSLTVTDDQALTANLTIPITIYDLATPAVQVQNLTSTDRNNNPKTNFTLGNFAQFDFSVVNVGAVNISNGLFTLELIDPTDIPIFIGYSFNILNVGESKQFAMGCTIPLNGSQGTYTAKVMIFTDWPGEHGISLGSASTTITVS